MSMAVDLQFDLRMPDGSDAVSAMSRIIEKRTKELGETTAQSCTALAINIMKGIRASTKTANMKADITVTDVSGTYYPSWRRNKGAKGKKVSERVLRSGKDGAVIQKDKVMWLCGPYKKGEVLHTYEVVDKVAEGKEYKWLAVAESDRVARRHAEKFHKARVKRARGLAKYALGLAMHKVHSA